MLAAGAFSATVYHFRSSDSAATWTYLPTAHDAKAGYPNFLTPTHWLELNSAEETTDGGQSWHSLDTDYAGAGGLGAVVFPTPDVGYGPAPTTVAFTSPWMAESTGPSSRRTGRKKAEISGVCGSRSEP